MSTDNRESRPRTVTDDELTPGPGRRGTRSPVSCHDRRPDLRITMFELEPRQTTPAGANARNIDDEQACEAAHQLSQGRAAGTFAAETAAPHEGGNTHARYLLGMEREKLRCIVRREKPCQRSVPGSSRQTFSAALLMHLVSRRSVASSAVVLTARLP